MQVKFLPTVAALASLIAALVASPARATEPAPDRAAQRFEIRFMQMTIEHHMMGAEMAEICLNRATPPPPEADTELRDLCATIAEVQSQEAEQLQQWLTDWYGISSEPKMPPGPLRRLQRAEGETFDVLVSEMFIDHHLQQIRNSATCLERADHRELLEMCQQMIAEQSAEIIVFRDILDQHGAD